MCGQQQCSCTHSRLHGSMEEVEKTATFSLQTGLSVLRPSKNNDKKLTDYFYGVLMTPCSVLDKNATPQKRVWYMAFDPNLFLIHDWSFFWLLAGEKKEKKRRRKKRRKKRGGGGGQIFYFFLNHAHTYTQLNNNNRNLLFFSPRQICDG